MTALPRDGDLIGGKYRIIRLIGEGGMGAVYEAHHEHLDSRVALKFLHPDLQQSAALVARFLQEARVSASIKSPHVTQVIDVDQTPEGAAYLVMELLEGESLERRMERQMPFPLGEAVDIGLQVLSALDVAHARGVVHRDLKPDNVWLSPSPAGPYVKLLDFGIAKLKSTDEFREVNTRPGSMMGTPAYMAPEQAISADQVDARADLYSFGVILFEMLSGKRPVDSDDPREILEKLIRGDVRRLSTECPDLPPALAALVDRLVSPDAERRPASAAVVRAELVPHARATGVVWQGDRQSDVAWPSGLVSRGDRLSAQVPPTVPPDDRAAPAFLTHGQASHPAPAYTSPGPGPAPGPARMKTAAMGATPGTPGLAFAPTAIATHGPAAGRRVWPWVLGALVVAALGGAGVWASFNPSIFDTDAPPPLPGPLPSARAGLAVLDAGVPGSFSRTRPGQPARPAPRPSGPTGSPGASSPPGTPGPVFPQFPQLPPFSIPSGLIPSSLPPYFPQIPGWTVPATPTTPPPTAPQAPAAPAAPAVGPVTPAAPGAGGSG